MKLKKCDRCQESVSLRYRVQYDQSKNWYQICSDCWHIVATNNPHYRYGGTWKGKKRK